MNLNKIFIPHMFSLNQLVILCQFLFLNTKQNNGEQPNPKPNTKQELTSNITMH